MPRKPKPREPVASSDRVWIAPRPASATSPRTFGPVGLPPSNRYLEFADIALGCNDGKSRTKKATKANRGQQVKKSHDSEEGVTPIKSRALSNRGFGAFRSSR